MQLVDDVMVSTLVMDMALVVKVVGTAADDEDVQLVVGTTAADEEEDVQLVVGTADEEEDEIKEL